MKQILIFILSIVIVIISIRCNNNDGLFGNSTTKEEAKANGSNVVEYIANKTIFNLIDGTVMKIDTAWTEVSFTYKNGKRVLNDTYGYHFSIPFMKQTPKIFTFSFELTDTTNRIFTNGMDENMTQLCPKILYDTMRVSLEQRNPDTSVGWMKPIVTDTIIFTKINR
jgi:hypothetical protein